MVPEAKPASRALSASVLKDSTANSKQTKAADQFMHFMALLPLVEKDGRNVAVLSKAGLLMV